MPAVDVDAAETCLVPVSVSVRRSPVLVTGHTHTLSRTLVVTLTQVNATSVAMTKGLAVFVVVVSLDTVISLHTCFDERNMVVVWTEWASHIHSLRLEATDKGSTRIAWMFALSLFSMFTSVCRSFSLHLSSRVFAFHILSLTLSLHPSLLSTRSVSLVVRLLHTFV